MDYFVRTLFSKANKGLLILGVVCLILSVPDTILSFKNSNNFKDLFYGNVEAAYIDGESEYVSPVFAKVKSAKENTDEANKTDDLESIGDTSDVSDLYDLIPDNERIVRVMIFAGVLVAILIIVNIISRTVRNSGEEKSILKDEDISGKFYRNNNYSQRTNVRKVKKRKIYIENYDSENNNTESDSDGDSESVYGAGDVENEGNTYEMDNDEQESVYSAGDIKNEGSRVADGDINAPSEYVLEILKNEGSSYQIPDNIDEIESEYGGEKIKNDESAFRISDTIESGAYGTAQIENSKENIYGELYEDNTSTSGYGNDEEMELSENIYGDLYAKDEKK